MSMWMEDKSFYWHCVNADPGKCFWSFELSEGLVGVCEVCCVMSNISAPLSAEEEPWWKNRGGWFVCSQVTIAPPGCVERVDTAGGEKRMGKSPQLVQVDAL